MRDYDLNQGQLAIIGAMDEEIELLLASLTHRSDHIRAGITFHQGQLMEKQIIVCKTGVGKVNAAVVTQILIDQFAVSGIIFTGVAGALDPELEIGDIVISTDCMHHDMDVTALGFSKGEIPYQQNSIFKADAHLIQLAQTASTQVTNCRIYLGRILSGDQFINHRDQVAELYQTFGGMCTEMEGAAVAQVCTMNQVPFVIIRSMSDRADGSADVNFVEFSHFAARHSFSLVEQILLNI